VENKFRFFLRVLDLFFEDKIEGENLPYLEVKKVFIFDLRDKKMKHKCVIIDGIWY
jgi:hypothetical protein